MGAKPKARKAAGKTARKRIRKDAPLAEKRSQSERFIEAARAVGVDESGKEFERALKVIIPRRRDRPRPS